ncbi:MAG: phenylacetate--CoA ligase PaaK [Salinirussus sp.]
MYTDTERLDRARLRELQSERLRETVAYAYENVPFYRDRLDEAGLEPGDVEGVEDVTKLPTTTKEDFRDEYPDGLFAVDDEEILRIHASSGTTGKPKIVAYTEDDLGVWNEVMARSLDASGIEPGDTVQNAYGYGLFTGGLGFHEGAETLGAAVVPTSSGGTQRQVELAADLGSDVLACTPSYALYFAETAEEMGHDPADLPISAVTYGAETCTDPMREEIEQRLGATGINNYGLSEVIGPGVAAECHEAQTGLHVWEDHFYPEIVDPDTGEPLPEGEEGELVLTTLTKEALPVLRYRTGDLTTLDYDECACGRTMVRMDNVTGRTDDLLIVRGVNLYPSEVEDVVLDIDGVAPHYRIDLRTEDNLDVMELTVERADTFDGDAGALHDEIHERLQNVLGFTPDDLSLVAPGGIERTEVGKVQRVFDHR